MRSERGAREPAIQRCYTADETSCAQALRLLLSRKIAGGQEQSPSCLQRVVEITDRFGQRQGVNDETEGKGEIYP
jgi:hypothetical protein